MSKKMFEKGDLIFAKVRGYPAWPARVESRTDSFTQKLVRYKVFFYGTFETGICKPEEVFTFEETKEKFGAPKKHKFFNKAMHEIETMPNITGPPENKYSPASPEKVVDSEVKGDKAPTKEKTPIAKKIVKTGKTTAVRPSSSTPSQSETQRKTETRNRSKNTKVETPLKTEANDGNEQASLRSARTNSRSRKRSASKSKTTQLIGLKTSANVKANADEQDLCDDRKPEQSPSPESLDTEPGNSKTQNKEETKEKSDESCEVVMTRRQALNLLNMDDVPLSLRNKVCDILMSKYKVKHAKKIKHKETKESKLEFLKEEFKLMTTERKLKDLLGRNKVGEVSEALALLDEVTSVKMQPLMLKKQPKFVTTICKLCHYTGCVEQWKLDEECKNEFLIHASNMREKASQIYQQIKDIFARPDDDNFYRWFLGEVTHLRRIMSSSEDFVYMTQEPIVVDLESDEEVEMEVSEQGTTNDTSIKDESKIGTEEVAAENEEISRMPLQNILLNNSLTEEME